MLAEAFLVATGSSWWSSPAPAGQRSRHHPPSHHQQGNHHHHTPGPTNVCLPCCNCCTSVVHSTILSVLLTVDIFIYIYINMIIRCNDSLSVIQVHFPFYLSRCYCQAVTDPEKRQVSGADITLGQVSAWQVTKPWPI